ncbi:GNAT family N-acetyltransferase [Sporolactobacillus sp. THM7-4]|nr:GNAT family N-acetyltransferase [Sporolactobacillus sp. THM7-4]
MLIVQIKPSLRKAKNGDLDFVFELNKVNFKDFIDKIRGWDDKIEYQDLKQIFHPDGDFIITLDKKDIGFLSLQFNSNNIHVRHIEILPQYKHKGIGTKIFDSLKEKELPITLEVTKNNIPAYLFYRKLGFQVMDEVKTLKNGVRGAIPIIKVMMKLNV